MLEIEKNHGSIALRLNYFNVWYVGVIWFVFHVLQFVPIRFTQQNLCCISK